MPHWFLAVWLVWAVISVCAVLAGFRWYNRNTHRRVTDLQRDSSALVHYYGGLRWQGPAGVGNASMPLGKLELFDQGIRLGPSGRLLRVFVPTWEASYRDLASVDSVLGPLRSKGVRFRLREDGPPIVFWTTAPKKVLNAMAGHGVTVIPATTKLPWMSNQ